MDKSKRRIPLALRNKIKNDNTKISTGKKSAFSISRHVQGVTNETLEKYEKEEKVREMKKRQAEDNANMGGVITNEDLLDELDEMDFKDKLEFIRSQPKYKNFTYNSRIQVYKKYAEIKKIEFYYENYDQNEEETEEEYVESEEEYGVIDESEEEDEEDENKKNKELKGY
jgi:hypothetical protein